MSIASEITRIKNNIGTAYGYCQLMGATMPSLSNRNSANLGTTIGTIPQGGETHVGTLTGTTASSSANGQIDTATLGEGVYRFSLKTETTVQNQNVSEMFAILKGSGSSRVLAFIAISKAGTVRNYVGSNTTIITPGTSTLRYNLDGNTYDVYRIAEWS